MEKNVLRGLQGVAVSCLIAVIAALALTREGIEPDAAILMWLGFVVLCGVVIAAPLRSFGQLLALSLPASVALVLTLLVRGVLGYLTDGNWIEPSGVTETSGLATASGIYAFILIASPIGISIALIARNSLVQWARRLIGLNPEKISNTGRIIEGLAQVTALIAALILGGTSAFAP